MYSYAGGDAIRHWPEVIAEHRRERFKVCFLPGLYGGPKLTKPQIYRNKSYKMTQSQCPSSNSGPSAHSAAQPSFTENTKACRASNSALFSALRRAHVTGLKMSGDAWNRSHSSLSPYLSHNLLTDFLSQGQIGCLLCTVTQLPLTLNLTFSTIQQRTNTPEDLK